MPRTPRSQDDARDAPRCPHTAYIYHQDTRDPQSQGTPKTPKNILESGCSRRLKMPQEPKKMAQ
eukprot:6707056-Pyramimonas_sp.AAC.2